MAKLGEGDPRWLVQERADGANVNNWHWTEKDCLEWSKQRLNELFLGLQLVDGQGTTVVTNGIDSVTGEAFINVRKNKLIPSYELEIKLKWSGEVKDGDGNSVGSAQGKIHLPYVADENHDEVPEMRIVCDGNDNASQRLKEAIQGKGKKVLLDTLNTFVAELRAGGPAADGKPDQASAATTTASKPKLSSADKPQTTAPATSTSAAVRTKAKSLNMTERFYARPQDLFDCFTIEGKVCAFTQSKATVEPRVGGTFSWFNGSLQGEFEELQPPNKLVMKWRFNTWEDGRFSKVVLDITEPEHGSTVVTLKHTDIPDADRFGNIDVFDHVEKGWQTQVFQKIRAVFGYGV